MFGLAAVLAGIATLEFVLAFVYTPALFAVAVPFAAAAYLVWYHASGRLRDRVEEGRAGAYGSPGSGPNQRTDPRTESERGGFGAGPRESYSGRRGGFDADQGGFDAGQGGFGSAGAGRAGPRGRASAAGRAAALPMGPRITSTRSRRTRESTAAPALAGRSPMRRKYILATHSGRSVCSVMTRIESTRTVSVGAATVVAPSASDRLSPWTSSVS